MFLFTGSWINCPLQLPPSYNDRKSITCALLYLSNLDYVSEQPLRDRPSNAPVEDLLWVDRYRPKKFTDLLGNERVARDAMTWIKQWDWCVFGKARGKKRNWDGDENVNQDEYKRPHEKVNSVLWN